MMKKIKFLLIVIAIVATSAFDSCKSKSNQSPDTPAETMAPADTPPTVAPPPVVISSDDVLTKGVTDAIKDYPSVKAEVLDNVINLSGEIKRADWQKLNPTLNSLHPKRINSANLTIK
ncbi:MAG: hypothetical protein ABI416_11445 [Ginsengibacter sp.]